MNRVHGAFILTAGFLLLLALATSTAPVAADSVELECAFEHPEWRADFSASVMTVALEEDAVCMPDEPRGVGVSVLGANNAADSLMVETSLSERAVGKDQDMDGDGDYDVVDMELEITPVGERPEEVEAGSFYGWGSGDRRWLFAPKTRGVGVDDAAVRPPSPTLRFEEGGLAFIWVENHHRVSHEMDWGGVTVGTSRTPLSADDALHPGDSGMYTLRPSTPGVYIYRSTRNAADGHMGLGGLLIVEEDRPENQLQSYNVGGGKVRAPAASVDDAYDAEYDLVYGSRNHRVTEASEVHDDPDRVMEVAEQEGGAVDEHLLNGRSYPDTLKESLLVAEEGDRLRLNVGNVGVDDVTVASEAGDLSVYDYGTGEYSDVESVELAPGDAEQLRLKVGDVDEPRPIYVEEAGRYGDDAATTLVASPSSIEEGLPREVPFESSLGERDGEGVGSQASLFALSIGLLLGALTALAASVVLRRRRSMEVDV